jgi:HAD superfamily hydrolase (TIGR01490 family)
MTLPEDRALAVFDLDRTLTRRGTWSPFLLYAARRHAPWRLALVPAALVMMIAYKARMVSRKRLKEVMQALLLGGGPTQWAVGNLADGFAEKLMRSQIFADGLALIREEQLAGRRVIIATASFDFYAQAIGRNLGIADVIGTKSIWKDGCLRARVDGQNCYGASKLAMIEDFMMQQHIPRSPTHVRFYSDDISDMPTFQWADEAVAVNPSPQLSRHANRQGWCVFDWR